MIEIDGLSVYFINIHDLLKNKESSGRPQDNVDADMIRKSGLL
jgi:hypothetical protein